MEDKDRMIVTFGGDDTESESVDVLPASGGGTSIDVDIPQAGPEPARPYEDTIVGDAAEQYYDDFRAHIDRYEAEKKARIEAEEHARREAEEAARREAEEQARREAEEAARGEAAASYYSAIDTGSILPEEEEYLRARAASDTQASAPAVSVDPDPYISTDPYAAQDSYAAQDTYATQDTYVRPAKDPRYVTKGFLAVCMVLTMLVSTLLGAFLGGAFSGSLSGNKAADDRTPRDDQNLSQLELSDGSGESMTVKEVIDQNADAVVEILVSGTTQGYFGQMQPVEGAGSGVIVREDGYIVTNYHVIQGANKVQVTLHNGETYPASIVGGDNEKDIAVIKISAKGLTVASIGDSSKVSVGDTAIAIGNPLGQLGGTATSGIISALDRSLTIDGRTLTLMQTDAAINGGNSGGGLFNSKGELIGIVDAKSSGVGIEGLAFAIPINSVADTINDLIENGNVKTRPVVGITIQDVSEENAQYYQLESAGVYIAQVTGENAKKAGFEQGDRIVSFDGEAIESSQQFISIVRKHKAGDNVAIVVSRGGQEIEIRTEIEEYTSTEN